MHKKMSVYHDLKDFPGSSHVEGTLVFSEPKDRHMSCKTEEKSESSETEIQHGSSTPASKIQSAAEEKIVHSANDDRTVICNVKAQVEYSSFENQPNNSIKNELIFVESEKCPLSNEIEQRDFSEPIRHTIHNAPEDENQPAADEKAVSLVNEDQTVDFNVKAQTKHSAFKNQCNYFVKDELDSSDSEDRPLSYEIEKRNFSEPIEHTDHNAPKHETQLIAEEETGHPVNGDQTVCSYVEQVDHSAVGNELHYAVTEIKTVGSPNEAQHFHRDTELQCDHSTVKDQPCSSRSAHPETLLEFLSLTSEEKYSNFSVVSPSNNDSDSTSSLEDEHRVGYWYGGPTPPPSYNEANYPELYPPPPYACRKYGQRPPFVATLWFCMMAFMYIMDVCFSPWDAPTLVKCGFLVVWIITFFLAEIMYIPEMIFNI